jgi:hypothetical protein
MQIVGNVFLPITVVMWSKATTVFTRLNAGIVGSNPTQGMDVCVHPLPFTLRKIPGTHQEEINT